MFEILVMSIVANIALGTAALWFYNRKNDEAEITSYYKDRAEYWQGWYHELRDEHERLKKAANDNTSIVDTSINDGKPIWGDEIIDVEATEVQPVESVKEGA